ncbi:hypothetical protein BD626DRAFT_499959 [Schizophyllum amplum]|uniref:Uncharacterized protein n=1 Tax=Schizophyllum amplum TaxID=97359 RepID=A0A550CBD6_9AGAR|nr:hypothetical protein BD626DRAFT_499959 [Auriculariopsis ampla]
MCEGFSGSVAFLLLYTPQSTVPQLQDVCPIQMARGGELQYVQLCMRSCLWRPPNRAAPNPNPTAISGLMHTSYVLLHIVLGVIWRCYLEAAPSRALNTIIDVMTPFAVAVGIYDANLWLSIFLLGKCDNEQAEIGAFQRNVSVVEGGTAVDIGDRLDCLFQEKESMKRGIYTSTTWVCTVFIWDAVRLRLRYRALLQEIKSMAHERTQLAGDTFTARVAISPVAVPAAAVLAPDGDQDRPLLPLSP